MIWSQHSSQDGQDSRYSCVLDKYALSSILNMIMKCTNCVQIKRQLDDALLQLKSLQKIIELLQQDNGDSRVLNHEDTADKSVL
jgi:hypothetical protein